MIRTATPADLPRLIELFATSNDAPYDLGVVADEKCFGAGVSSEPEVRVYGDFAGVSVTCGKFLRILTVDRSQRRNGIGSALLHDAKSRGARMVASEAGNYFTPGVAESDTGTIEFFLKHGYREMAKTQNLIVDVRSAELEEGVARATEETRERILDFIEDEFSPIWRFEVGRAFDNDPATMFYAEADGEIAGFAAHEANNRGLGFFGPTGVGSAYRGRGIGARLLRASLSDLHRLGYKQAIIPWTNTIDFYRKACGAEVQERFVTMGVL